MMKIAKIAGIAKIWQLKTKESEHEQLSRRIKSNEGEPKHAVSPLQQVRPRSRPGATLKRCGAKRSVATKTNEKAVRQQDGLLFQGRIVPTEFEKDHQNFLAKSYWPVKGSVKGFLENKCFCFQWFSNLINMHFQMTKNVISRVSIPVNNSFSAT
jgi:hypothetical protein